MDGRQAAATLGVGPRATRDEIRQAFRVLAKVAHPDAGPAGSAERFITLRQAVERLLADAPDAADVLAVEGVAKPAPSRFEDLSAGIARHGRALDLTDTLGRPRPRPRSQPRPGPTPRVGGCRAPSGPGPVTRDAQGLSFDDHLTEALSQS